jgi:hypothetical protein
MAFFLVLDRHGDLTPCPLSLVEERGIVVFPEGLRPSGRPYSNTNKDEDWTGTAGYLYS